ncbi:rab-GTPase-TBC domain-containing protein [Xylogone sp. PMI_703]|nr:rab-GTPase-TBC domain-containing protein [Xylogone sp. PMI_703]
MSDLGHHDTAEPTMEKRESDTEDGDFENDTFEDANDTAAESNHVESPSQKSRSLTERPSSSGTGAAKDPAPEQPPLPPRKDDETDGEAESSEKDTRQPKSPLLTSHRLSTSSSMDNVALEEDGKEEVEASREPSPADSKRSRPSLQGLSGVLPSVPWGPPPAPTPAPTNIAPPAQAPPRRLTGPFSWLRSSTPKEIVTSPPQTTSLTERRNTASSIATISSNPEMMLSKLDEGDETDSVNGNKRIGRNSLKDRFKLLRLREEAGITLPDDEKEANSQTVFIGRTTSLTLNVASPTEKEDIHVPTSPMPTSPLPTSANPALAPGTVSGVSAGPSSLSDPSAPVDWDLWQAVVYEGPAAVARTSAEELNKAIMAGIPNAIRGVVWQVLAQSKNEELEVVYKDLLARGTDREKDRMSVSSSTPSVNQTNGSTNGKEKDSVISSSSSTHSENESGVRSPSPIQEKDLATILSEKKKKAKEDAANLQKLEKAIRRDLGARTSYSKFAASAGLQEGLFGVCKAYALYDEAVGYAQGMNFLIMPLLFNMPEEEAFCLLVRLMNHYHLRDLFIQDMPGLHMHLYQFERLLEDFEPALYCHLHRRQVTPHLYATQWFLTLFSYRFPLQLVLRIYDLILSEGLEAILKFGIVLMQKNASTLLGMTDMAQLTTFLKDRLFDIYIDQTPSAGSILESGFFGSSGGIDKEIYRADQMVQDACAVKITPEILKAYAAEWEEKRKIEKEREAELEALKKANQSLTKKVRVLEERVQEHDSEHAALATELVRTKVKNEELEDENESLKGQTEELRRLVEKQPEEVEARLRGEMERLMNRNQEVHLENSRLEDEMAEMEKELVETKLKYAEINAQCEAINRKFTELRKALD